MQIIEYNGEGYKTVHVFENWRIGLIRPADRFSKVEQLERHMLTDEAFILLEVHAKLYDEENVYEMEKGKIYKRIRAIGRRSGKWTYRKRQCTTCGECFHWRNT